MASWRSRSASANAALTAVIEGSAPAVSRWPACWRSAGWSAMAAASSVCRWGRPRA
uniref:ORF-55 n=1 Tax=Halobacterium salinarum TaxID=2242 RepID=Q47974_HALSI|nr:unnamed protein product [Halobacterium salinarum]prf//1604196A elongation factor 2 assocd ORF [Halobacterium salinarum]